MRYTLLIVVGILGIMISCMAGAAVTVVDRERANQLYAEASRIYTDDLPGAIALYQRVLQVAPDSYKTYFNLGSLHATQQRCGQAIRYFDLYLELELQPKSDFVRHIQVVRQSCTVGVADNTISQYGIVEVTVAPGEVVVDGETMIMTASTTQPSAMVTQAWVLTAGLHTFFVKRKGFRDLSRTVEIRTGHTQVLELVLQPQAVATVIGEPLSPPPNRQPFPWKAATVVGLGVGAALAGVVFDVQASGSKNEAVKHARNTDNYRKYHNRFAEQQRSLWISYAAAAMLGGVGALWWGSERGWFQVVSVSANQQESVLSIKATF